jgi:hypothetical protein
MKIWYKLSDKARAEGIKDGKELEEDQRLEFVASDLTPKARELWVQLFGNLTQVTLRTPVIRGGRVWSDGSADDDPPCVSWGDEYKADKVLAVSDLEAVLSSIAAQRAALEAEILPQRRAEWQKARVAYEARLAERKAKEEAEKKAEAEAEQAKAQRMANLPWVKQLTQKLTVLSEAEAEIKRFCQKFALERMDIQTDSISDKPYVRITTTVPITVNGMRRDLNITNKVFTQPQEGYEEEQYLPAEFSDLAHSIAKTLAEIFNGETEIVYNYKREEAYLNVVSPPDTIKVASCTLERDDC